MKSVIKNRSAEIFSFNLMRVIAFCTFTILWLPLAAHATTELVQVGLGGYVTKPKGSDSSPPSAPYRSGVMLQRAIPTNQWYSRLLFNARPEALFATPLSVKPTLAGFEMSLPSKQVVPTSRGDVEIQFPHANPLILKPTAFKIQRTSLANASDWSIDIAMSDGEKNMQATVSHGSPYVYFELTEGNLLIQIPKEGQRIEASDERVLVIKSGDKTYAVFGPTGVHWEKHGESEWLAVLPENRRYFSAAGLPDSQLSTVQEFQRHAYAFVRDTRAEWHYDTETSNVQTRFKSTTQIMEGEDNGPLLGLYPHQWFNNEPLNGKLHFNYDTVRGKIQLLAASEFTTDRHYTGLLPFWPSVSLGENKGQLEEVMQSDLKQARSMMLPMGEGSYWQGKGLQRITQLMSVIEQQGDIQGRDKLLKLVKGRIEQWFSGESRRTYFHYDKEFGTVAGYPEEYFSIQQMNDHHFHYGYWIRAAADVALRDPKWAQSDQWGGMVDLLIKDIATDKRGQSEFPFLRNFDIYEGHSWASGVSLGSDGNNQESSSEAVNAWAGLILWGEIKGDKRLRDLGIWLYTSEIESIQNYWFDLNKLVLAPEYQNVEVSMLFGGKYAHNTWWIDEPREIHGINLLPMTTASMYLARDPSFILKNLAAMDVESSHYKKRVEPSDIWNDIFLEYLALAQPKEALTKWSNSASVEFGDTRSHTLHWLLTLQQRGRPLLDITANTPLYGVFRTPEGVTTYLVYNVSEQPRQVRFSDGQLMTAAPKSLSESKKAP
jgi:endoglucanase Acf2